MTREEIEKARDLLKMIEVKEPNELIVNSWWGSFAKDYKEALQIAIKVLEQEHCEDCVSRKGMLSVLSQSHSLTQVWEGFEKLPSVIPKQQPCDDCISRQAAIDAMIKLEQDDIECYGCAIPEGFNSTPAIEALNNLPSVTLKEKIGKWIGDKCSNCGNERAWYGNNPLFCPDCGARMVSE